MARDKRSLMERLLSGKLSIPFGERYDSGYESSVELSAEEVWVRGSSCSIRVDEEQVAEIHEALGVWLRMRRNKDLKRR